MDQRGVRLIMVESLHVYKGIDRNSAVQFILLTLILVQTEIRCFEGRIENSIDLELPDHVC
jgi:hypothetical protein